MVHLQQNCYLPPLSVLIWNIVLGVEQIPTNSNSRNNGSPAAYQIRGEFA